MSDGIEETDYRRQAITSHTLTREQVEKLADHIANGQLEGYINQWLDHDAAQRRTMEQQAQEIERLQQEVYNRNQRALDGDKAVAVRESILDTIDRLTQQLATMTAERDAAQQRYERQCAGTKSRLEEIVHLRSDCQKLQTLLTAGKQEAGRLRIALNGILHMDDYEMRKAHVERALKGA